MDANEGKSAVEVRGLDRRDFLKKAGLASGAAAMLWITPSIVSIGARPAYASVSGVTTNCFSVVAELEANGVVCFRICNSCDKAVSHVSFAASGTGFSGGTADGVDDDRTGVADSSGIHVYTDNCDGDWAVVTGGGIVKYEEPGELPLQDGPYSQNDDYKNGKCVNFYVRYTGIEEGDKVTVELKAGNAEDAETTVMVCDVVPN